MAYTTNGRISNTIKNSKKIKINENGYPKKKTESCDKFISAFGQFEIIANEDTNLSWGMFSKGTTRWRHIYNFQRQIRHDWRVERWCIDKKLSVKSKKKRAVYCL